MFIIVFWFVYFFIICKINTLKILLTTQVNYIYIDFSINILYLFCFSYLKKMYLDKFFL